MNPYACNHGGRPANAQYSNDRDRYRKDYARTIAGGPGVPRPAKGLPPYAPILIALLFIIGLCPSSLGAQPVPETARFKKLLIELHEQLAQTQAVNNAISYHDLFDGNCDHDDSLPLEGDILREQSARTAKISGLELRGAYNTGTLTESGDSADGIDQGRGNLELSWDILNGGYRQNALRAEAQSLQALQADVDSELRMLDDAGRCRQYRLEKAFSQDLIRLLQIKLRLMEPVYGVERRAYFKHWSLLDDYLVSEQDLMLTRHELQTLLADPYYDNSSRYQSPAPILNVDLANLLAAVRNDRRYEVLYATEKQWLKTKHAADIRDSLRVFVRKEFDIAGDGENQNDIIAGVRFTVPLYSRKTNLLKLELNRVARDEKRHLSNRIARVRSAYTALQEQLQRTVSRHYSQARADERLRRTLWMVENEQDQLLTTAITRMRTLIDARIELIRAKETLYRKVNEMFLVSEIPYRPDLIQTVPLRPERVRARPGNRSIYIWSDEFNRLKNSDLLAIMEAKQITSALISAGRKTQADKLYQFLDQLASRNLDAELIVGDNNWTHPRNFDKAVARSVVAAERTGRLHLDIEPQTLPDYRDRRHEYLAHFARLVKKTKRALLDRQLSIAVPFNWPAETYKALGADADKLYVMAYGSDKFEVLARRIQPMLASVPADKIVVVLRADDFADEWEIEQMIEHIMAQTAIDQFAIHELEGFIAKTVSPYEIEN